MSTPFLAEIKLFASNFAPRGWALCNGQTLPVNQNQALFSLLGTTYGGDGRATFQLPNLQGAAAIHMGNGHTLGEVGGQETHTLTQAEMPTHTHQVMASGANGSTGGPAVPAAANNLYGPPSSLTSLDPSSLTPAGGSQPHQNMQPFLVLNFCIALEGVFPSRG